MNLPALLILFVVVVLAFGQDQDVDLNGYITYCPCMGRFGNQADHFLGALAFSKRINRTLIIPPWVEYVKGKPHSVQVDYDTYFDIDKLSSFHRVISMRNFMETLSHSVWPREKRVSFCYMERKSLNAENKEKDCFAKEGNPFGPFWDTFDINFVGSEFFGPLHYDVHHSNIAEEWKRNYDSKNWPVLAFTGAPATYPVQMENRELQKYVVWNKSYVRLAENFIKENLPKGAFIGIHLRNGIDWVRACEHVKTSSNLFASPQCLGYNNEKGSLYDELCFPGKETIIRQLKRLIKKIKEVNKSNEVRSIFVASDNNHMIEELNNSLTRMKISAHKLPSDNPHLDLAILGMSNYFIGNCISSFSAFVKRERDVKGFPSYFWAYPKEKDRQNRSIKHEEL